ncbi:hypothetical protein L228DRAFT_265864 [Xylona heveae TC161]|uniref:Uncharacterized protein n=1 Tax=Xylona heveae (strain CBS 132557 / TC161) TaxID=1328760 RepID=A0A165IU65_XYLHT|nr:hypothetical protein L228DRAFT_265864 [Xylona heveae TC161]KZF25395.1 hypothetical protein L228DRAFT_265864 [Xylona heveae TC161]
MKYVLAPLVFGLGASAAALKRADQCCFTLTASGGKNGTVGQLSDGQNRIGGPYSPANYCLDNGGITDSNHRGCILTPPTTQFQCDEGAKPTGGFAVGSNGQLTHDGSQKFYACGTGDNGAYNIYTSPVENQKDCTEISLTASGCGAQGNTTSSAPTQASTPASSASSIVSSASSSSSIQTSPAPSQPASSQPAGSQPPSGPSTSTIYSTSVVTITSCGPEVTSCPAGSAPGPSSSVPVTESSVPQSSAPTGQPSSAPSQAPSSSAPASVPQSSVPASSQAPSSSAPVSVPQSSVPASSQAPSSSAPASVPQSSAPASSQAPSSSAPASVPQSSAPASTPSSQASTAQSSTPAPSSTQPSSTQPQSSSTVPTSSAPSSSGSGCPTDLNGNYQYPHLIVYTSNKDQNKASGTQYNGEVNSEISTIFNFDIPQSYEGKTCSLMFLFPQQSQLETSSYNFTGSGSIDFAQLSSPATQSTTYANAPGVQTDFGAKNVSPGNSYPITSFPCPAGQALTYEAKLASGDLSLSYFEDWNPSPIGLFIRQC